MERKKGFEGKRWGVFYHFLHGSQPDKDIYEWDKRVAAVDVDLWADQLAELGADFMGLPLMQVSRHMVAPNETYDRITGYKPGEACARRDFVKDLAEALNKRGIDLMLYYTGDGPLRDEKAAAAFGCPPVADYKDGKWNDCAVTEEFVDKWCEVLKEYVLRYKDIPFAWWIDGAFDGGPVDLFGPTSCPFYINDRDRLLKKFKDTVKLGNPDALISYNGGVLDPIRRYIPLDDFTAGERWKIGQLPYESEDDIQWFQFLCGYYWYNGETPESGYAFTPEEFLDYTQKIVDKGGVVMYDVHFVDDKKIDAKEWEILSALKNLR